MDLELREKYLKVKKYFVVRIKESARQTHEFVVRRTKAHDKHMSLSCAGIKAHGKVFLKNDIWLIRSAKREEKYFVVGHKKRTANT
jgi:hypothetical protein